MAIGALEEGYVQVQSQYTRNTNLADHFISEAVVKFKADYVRAREAPAFLSECVPCLSSSQLPVESEILDSLHGFASANPMYVRSYRQEISGIHSIVYESDINAFWLSSKKHDASYQPFYPTWLLSAYALAHAARLLGFTELVDIGSGDGRIAYCASLLGMKSYGIEIDSDLIRVQNKIKSTTAIDFTAIESDATKYDYAQLALTRPIFFISGLPEVGEMLAYGVIERILSDPTLRNNSGFNFMGSHKMKRLSRDHTAWGWGKIISRYGLVLKGAMTLPTYWTTEEPVDTPYVYAVCGTA